VLADGLNDDDSLLLGETEELGETLGEADELGEMLALGLTLGDSLDEGDAELLGEIDCDDELLGLIEALGLDEGLTPIVPPPKSSSFADAVALSVARPINPASLKVVSVVSSKIVQPLPRSPHRRITEPVALRPNFFPASWINATSAARVVNTPPSDFSRWISSPF
jgi:hypothetical protein